MKVVVCIRKRTDEDYQSENEEKAVGMNPERKSRDNVKVFCLFLIQENKKEKY